jgi:hypothetical protein
LVIDVNGIDNADDDGKNTAAGDAQSVSSAIALPIYQNRVPYPRLGIVQRNEIPSLFALQIEGLDHEQASVLEVRMADGGDDCSHHFSDNHETA